MVFECSPYEDHIWPARGEVNYSGRDVSLEVQGDMVGVGEWQAAIDENNAQMRFFKVEVVLP